MSAPSMPLEFPVCAYPLGSEAISLHVKSRSDTVAVRLISSAFAPTCTDRDFSKSTLATAEMCMRQKYSLTIEKDFDLWGVYF